MSSREQFEAWAIANEHAFKTDDGKLMFIEGWPAGVVAWDAWQEAQRQALERAEERCMSILGYPPREYYAKAIRALTEQPKCQD